jgi:cytochrome c oxidase subunit 2
MLRSHAAEVTVGLLILKVFLGVGISAIVAMVVMALYGARHPLSQDVVFSKGYVVRRYWLAIILIMAVAAFVVSMPNLPYAAASTAARHYPIVAQQYGFEMPAELPKNTPIVFDVTSRDVNHGFGIYDPKGRLIGQVQAMPDYVNHLLFEFRVVGRYTIRCMEYCGMGHAEMQSSFVVR